MHESIEAFVSLMRSALRPCGASRNQSGEDVPARLKVMPDCELMSYPKDKALILAEQIMELIRSSGVNKIDKIPCRPRHNRDRRC